MITILKATTHDALLITTLARKIYKEHYLHLWLPGGAKWYMEVYAYAGDKIENELRDPHIEYFIAYKDETALGYMKLQLNSSLPGYENSKALEVERIYLLKKMMGKGTGRRFMQIAMEKAKALKKEIIFLKAMDSSIEAIEFYKKLGYHVCGSFQLPMPAFSLMKKACRGMLILKREVI